MRHIFSGVLAVAILAIFAGRFPASSNEANIAGCAQIKAPLLRLACYDGIAMGGDAGAKADDRLIDGPERAKREGPQVEVKTGPAWEVIQDKNPLDDTDRVMLRLTALNGVSRWGQQPTLIARCQSSKTEVFIAWGDYLGNDSNGPYGDWKYVTVRIGDAPAEKQKWGVSTDMKATFAPHWAGDLLKKIAAAERLIVQTVPYGESPRTLEFRTAGLSDAMAPLKAACNWPSS